MLEEVHPSLQHFVGLDQHIRSPPKKTIQLPRVQSSGKTAAVNVAPVADPNTISDEEV
jgi:hypothetical protein